jgi:predicted transcriptional regulator
MTKTLTIGILNYEDFKARTLRIARGELKPGPKDPKVWFPSLESLARVLSEPNRELLAMIEGSRPQSLKELAELSGRATSNLSRTLKTMEKYGIVEMRERNGRRVAPRVAYSGFKLEMPFGQDGRGTGIDVADRSIGKP